MQGAQVQSLVEELRSSHVLHAWPKTKQNKTNPVDLTRKEGRLPRSHVHPGHGEFPAYLSFIAMSPLTQLPKISIKFLFAHSSWLGTHTYKYMLGLGDYPDTGVGHKMVGGAPLAPLRALGTCPLFSDFFSWPIKRKHSRESK